MKKIDSLLKKAASFEKLALFGRRSDFLASFATVTFPTVNISSKLSKISDSCSYIASQIKPYELKISDTLNKYVNSLHNKVGITPTIMEENGIDSIALPMESLLSAIIRELNTLLSLVKVQKYNVSTNNILTTISLCENTIQEIERFRGPQPYAPEMSKSPAIAPEPSQVKKTDPLENAYYIYNQLRSAYNKLQTKTNIDDLKNAEFYKLKLEALLQSEYFRKQIKTNEKFGSFNLKATILLEQVSNSINKARRQIGLEITDTSGLTGDTRVPEISPQRPPTPNLPEFKPPTPIR